MFISAYYIDSIIKNHNDLKSFALFLKLKVRYRNGIIYDYSPSKISKLFNVSEYHVRKLVSHAIKMGIIEKYSFNNKIRLRLISFKYLKNQDDKNRFVMKKININMTDSINVVLNKLRFVYIRYRIFDPQKYIQKTYASLNNRTQKNSKVSLRQLKKCVKKLSLLGYNPSENAQVNVYCGYRKLAGHLNISISSVKRLIDVLKRWKYIERTEKFVEKFLKCESFSDFLNLKKFDLLNTKYYYYYNSKNKYIYINKGTLYYISLSI